MADRKPHSARPVEVTPGVLSQIEQQVVAGYPNETCGILVGRELAGSVEVEEQIAIANSATDLRHRFELDPIEYLAADRSAYNKGLDVIGIWHSHPDQPAIPSQTDAKTAWEGYVYLILSVEKAKLTEAKAWGFEGSSFVERKLILRS